MLTKEQLVNYMVSGHIHLSKKDYGFFHNIKVLIQNNKSITSNQVKLVEKLITKYKKQLEKNKYSVDKLQSLSWTVEIIETKAEYLEPKLYIDNSKICIRSPFNTNFIEKFRKINANEFVWDKVSKIYTAPVSTYNFKIAYHLLTKIFGKVHLCSTLTEAKKELDLYEGYKYWKPTLAKRHDTFYIFGSNESIEKRLSELQLTLNDDPKTLFELSKMGIYIDESITLDSVQKFAISYNSVIDLDQIENLCKYLHTINVDCVFTAREIIYNKKIHNEIKITLLNQGITCNTLEHAENKEIVLLRTNFNLPLSNAKQIGKVITLTNSRPVEVR